MKKLLTIPVKKVLDSHLIYQLSSKERPQEALAESYSPLSVKKYLPQVEIYDQLMPQPKGGEKGAAILAATV